MRIAIAQINTVPGDFDRTVSRMAEQSRSAAEQGADLIIFPSAALIGIDAGGMARSDTFIADLTMAIDSLTQELACPALIAVALPMVDPRVPEAVLIRDGQAVPVKLLSWLAGSQGAPAPGEPHATSFEIAGSRISVAVGIDALEDLADHPDGSDMVIFLQAGALSIDDEESMLAAGVEISDYVSIAHDLDAWLVAAGGIGGYDVQVLSGGSFVMAPWGEMLAVAPSFEESLVVCEVDLMSEGPLRHPIAPAPLNRARVLWDALVLVTHDYIAKAGISDVVVPLAGDLSTSALAALAVDAAGPTHVHAVVLDAGDEARLADAREVARNLRIEVLEEVGARDWRRDGEGSPIFAQGLLDAACNAHAAVLGALPLSPRDKTFWALEASCPVPASALFEPFGDVYRTDIGTMMRQRMTVSPCAPATALARFDVPDVAPTTPGTTPEERLSAVDACLLNAIERGASARTIAEEVPAMEGCVEDALGRLAACEIYRRSSPVAPVMSARTLGELALLAGTPWREHATDADVIERRAMEPVGLADASEALSQAMAELERALQGSLPQEGTDRVSDVLSILHDFSLSGPQGAEDDGIFGWGLFSRN